MSLRCEIPAVVGQEVSMVRNDDEERAIIPRLFPAGVEKSRQRAVGIVDTVAVLLRLVLSGKSFVHGYVERLMARTGHHRMEER